MPYCEKRRQIDIGTKRIIGKDFTVIAGPCAIESREVLSSICSYLQNQGVEILRGGVFKPRTSPFSYQGIGSGGLIVMREIADKYSLKIVTEAMCVSELEFVAEFADIVQIGSRNSQNFRLLQAIAKINKPVLLKRGYMNTIQEYLSAADYILQGNPNVILCERGIRTFETCMRNTLDLAAVPAIKLQSLLPVFVDPSHGTGRSDLVIPMALAAKAVGADGIIVEIHPEPMKAKCDGQQALDFVQFSELTERLNAITTTGRL